METIELIMIQSYSCLSTILYTLTILHTHTKLLNLASENHLAQ